MPLLRRREPGPHLLGLCLRDRETPISTAVLTRKKGVSSGEVPTGNTASAPCLLCSVPSRPLWLAHMGEGNCLS